MTVSESGAMPRGETHIGQEHRLRVGCLFSDRIEGLLDGRVGIPGCKLGIEIREAQALFRAILNEGGFDIGELSMSSYIARSAKGPWEYVAVPVFLSRSFRHSNLYIRTDRGIASPADLRGRRIGLVDFQQTAALWMRGVLAEEYGVAREEVKWVTAGLTAPSLTDRAPMSLPQSIRCRRSTSTLDQLLRSGEIDAVISPGAPPCFADPNEPVDRLWPDHVAAERSYWLSRRIFPIMHVLVIRRELVEAQTDLAQRVFTAFEEARRLAAADLVSRDFPKIIVPWLGHHARWTRETLGEDPWSYGLERNRSTVETMLRYAKADGLVNCHLEIEDLFAPGTAGTGPHAASAR